MNGNYANKAIDDRIDKKLEVESARADVTANIYRDSRDIARFKGIVVATRYREMKEVMSEENPSA